MELDWIDRVEGLERAIDGWHSLAVRQGRPYCLPAWMMAWWRHASPWGAELRVLVLRRGPEVVGVGPFFIDRRFGLRRLRLLGAGVSSSISPLALPGEEPLLAAAIRDRIRMDRDAHLVMLESVPVEDAWTERLANADADGRGGLRRVPGWTQPGPFLELHGSGYDRWFADRGARFRARMRRGERQLENLDGRHILVERAGGLEDGLADFERLHCARWSPRGGSSVLDARVLAMLREFCRTSPENLRLWLVEARGRIVSAQLLVTAGGTVSHWLGGVDDGPPELHPGAGVLSLHRAIEHAWRSGDRLFEFGAGGQSFKMRFAGGETSLAWSILLRSRLHAVPALVPDLRTRTRVAIAQRLPESTKRGLRRLESRLRGRSDA